MNLPRQYEPAAVNTPSLDASIVEGSHVCIKGGPFEGYKGTVESTIPLKVKVKIFNRETLIEPEPLHVERTTM